LSEVKAEMWERKVHSSCSKDRVPDRKKASHRNWLMMDQTKGSRIIVDISANNLIRFLLIVFLLIFLFYFFHHKVGASTGSLHMLSADIKHLMMRTLASLSLRASILMND
jgi:hypothetical protein